MKNDATCKISGSILVPVIDLGIQALGNGFLCKSQFDQEYFYSLRCGFSETSKMFQLFEQPPAQMMFHQNYAFYSSTSNAMAKHFERFAEQVMQSKNFSPSNSFVIELGCNDGIMLKHFLSAGVRHLGIEPSANVAKVAESQGIRTIQEFFDENVAQAIVTRDGPADFFLAANVMCHIPDLLSVVRGISTLLKPTGMVIFEDPYLGDVIEKTSYDQIYDEHVFLFSAHSIQYLFDLHGFELINVQPQNTHGGSMRYTLARQGVYDVCPSVTELLNREKVLGLDRASTFASLMKNIEQSRSDLLGLLRRLQSEGKRIAGYGATSKSTTILNYCGIGPDLIEFISDTTPIKQGKFTPGMHIPVVPYEHFLQNAPDYAFLFAWNHAVEIISKETQYKANGGNWIVHVPKVSVF